MFYSFVIGYRNRELSRVMRSLDSLSNQTYRNFELIFLDYGSDEVISQEVKILVSSYQYAQYHYSDTRGWFWNRAHALNTGVKLAKGDIILFFDIDLILEPEFLNKLNNLSFDKTFYTFSCFYLPQHFKYENSVLERDGIHFEQNYVGLCALKKEHVFAVHGFDEYFMVWGVEDDDIYKRLLNFGKIRVQMKAVDFMVFHQWHQTQSPVKPTLWYLTMVNYFYSKDGKKQNNLSWGDRIEEGQRPVLNLIKGNDINLFISLEGSNGFLLYNDFINQFYEGSNKSGCLIYRETEYLPEKKSVNIFSRRKSVSMSLFEPKDIIQFIQYFIGVNRNSLVDYFLQIQKKGLKFYYVKK